MTRSTRATLHERHRRIGADRGGAEAAHRPAAGGTRSDADQTASDADQTASDADQTASDADQTASERDAADAASDQAAADSDQALADANAAARGEGDPQSLEVRQQRERTAVHRLITGSARAAIERDRLRTAAERDDTASQRDRRSEAFEAALDASSAPLVAQMAALRARAAEDRARAAEDRARAARERRHLEVALHQAHLDDLTGAFRRNSGTLAITQEIERARRGDGRFVLAFVDVDRLKEVNDRDGHPVGDEVLRRVAEALRSHLRSYDPVVRFGGDEFLCGLGGASLAEVETRFDHMAGALMSEAGIGVSVGLAELVARQGLDEDALDELVARADAALQVAKKKHRASTRGRTSAGVTG